MSMELTNYVVFGIKIPVEVLEYDGDDYEKFEGLGLDVIQFEDLEYIVIGVILSEILDQDGDTITEISTPSPQNIVEKLQQCGIYVTLDKIKLYHCSIWS